MAEAIDAAVGMPLTLVPRRFRSADSGSPAAG
jgi:hypothetical protein